MGEEVATSEKTLLVKVRMKGTTASTRTSWDNDAARKISEVMHNASGFLTSTGWQMSIESVEVLPDKT